MTIALAIMRLQPLHLGHQRVIAQMLKDNECAYLMIGSVNCHDERNPYSFAERKAMVEAIFAQEMTEGKLVVLPVEDINNRPKWAGHILNLLPEMPDIYYCGSNQDAELFEDKGLKIKEFDREEIKISATQVREKINNGDETWRQDVPPEIFDHIMRRK